MKSTLITLTIAAFVIACSSEATIKKSDLELSNLNGKVWKIEKRINDAHASCVCPAAQKDECDESLTLYDKEGNISHLFQIDPNGDTAVHLKYLYDRNGICSGIEKYSKEKLSGREVPEFKNGKLVKLKVVDENGETITTYSYKYAGDEISQIETVNSEGEVINKTLYDYNGGKLVSQTEKGKDGKVRSSAKYTMNENNDIIETMFSVPGDSSLHKVTYEYEYDQMGNWIKQTKYYRNEISNVVLRNITYFESSDPS